MISGRTTDTNFPVANAFQQKYAGGTDGFVAKVVDTSPATVATLAASPALISFQYVHTGPIPAPQSVSVTGPEQYFLTTNASWLTAQLNGSPVPPNNIQISVNPGSLTAGTYPAIVTIHPQSGAAVTTINVSLTVYTPPAVITSVDPSLVSIGSDDTLITIHGSGFLPGKAYGLRERRSVDHHADHSGRRPDHHLQDAERELLRPRQLPPSTF